ncbi:hypothetical protein ABZX30_02865 [Streptomyces sp. NPDC004542]|uniref:hypothetical protein n=1 Tax=Streptomyces sp. NPDC004542 TaxID=3154281 RepID=UPI00339E436F
MSDTGLASAALRSTDSRADGYTMELGLLNKGERELTSWRATITMPEGASVVAREGTAVAHDPGSRDFTVRPEPGTPLAPSERRTTAVEVRGTTRAPAVARFTAEAADGTTVQAPVALMAAVVDGESREADESTWPGATTTDTGPSGTEAKADTGEVGAGGGAGGGGGGGATTKFRVSFEWENDSGGGGGAGGGMNQGASGVGVGPQALGTQGAASDGQPTADWQQYQQKYQQSSQQSSQQTSAAHPLDEQIKELGERVAKLEGGSS